MKRSNRAARPSAPKVVVKNGIWFFKKETERTVFFFLTLAMLAAGLIAKWM